MEKLGNKIAAITSGNSGIGLAIAHRFVDEGAYVYGVRAELVARVRYIRSEPRSNQILQL